MPDAKNNQYGFALGGPIAQNKSFFFGDYQGTRATQGGSLLLNVPTDAARNGDFSAYGTNIYDPYSSADPSSRVQFPGNVIPANRLSPQALAILALLPHANATGRDNGTRDNYVASGNGEVQRGPVRRARRSPPQRRHEHVRPVQLRQVQS